MRYVQYFTESTINKNKLIQACGDRSVVILDGRYRVSRCIENAIQFNGVRRPLYPAFQIWEGESLIRSKPITDIIKMNEI